jgi:hypothetical protein
MDADGCVDEVMAIGEAHCGFEVRWTATGSNGEQPLDTGGAGTLNGLLPVFVEFGIVEVAVAVDQVHFSRAPTGISS